eukprot:518354_1
MNSIFSTLLMLILYITPNTSTVPPTMCPFNDTTPPEITCPDPIILEAYEEYPPNIMECSDPGNGPIFFNFNLNDVTRVGQEGNWEETDTWNALNCSEEILYKDLRTLTCFDQCNNKAQCYEEIIIKDTTKPVITCPDNFNVSWPLNWDMTATCEDATPTITNYDKVNIPQPGCESSAQAFDLKIREWTCTDACGKTDKCNQTIVVQDTTPPVWVDKCMDGRVDTAVLLSVSEYDPSNLYYIPTCWDIVNGTANKNAHGIFSWSDSAVNYVTPCAKQDQIREEGNKTIIAMKQGTVEMVYRNWACKDLCGNIANPCLEVLWIIDDLKPIIKCPADISIGCGGDKSTAVTGTATCTDNYDPNPIVTYGDSIINPIRTFECKDECIRQSQCDQRIMEQCPTSSPTLAPTQSPSIAPTQPPSLSPTSPPSIAPSLAPSNTPTLPPSIAPSNTPTQSPSLTPSNTPSLLPSIAPSQIPSNAPTISPTLSPTLSPSISPSLSPTSPPSISPSLTPTQPPSISPSIS